jgi:serine/threonine protein kinase
MTEKYIYGGKIINQGFKGMVMDVYNESKRDKKTLYSELKYGAPEEITLITIDGGKNIKIKGKEKIDNILEFIKTIKYTLVKKFIYMSFLFGSKKHNFNNELMGYKKLINIFKEKINKYTTIKSGFIYKDRKIYGLIFNGDYYIFLEKCFQTLDYIKFTQPQLNKCTKHIKETLDILRDHNYIHNDIKPNNIILCKNRFKIIDWEASGEIKKQPKSVFSTRNGNFAYNYPLKLYNLGVPFAVYTLIYNIELKVYKYKNKDLEKLVLPKQIHKKIFNSFHLVLEHYKKIKKTDKNYYVKLYDYYSFALTMIYLAEINKLSYNKTIINPIMEKFFIYL